MTECTSIFEIPVTSCRACNGDVRPIRSGELEFIVAVALDDIMMLDAELFPSPVVIKDTDRNKERSSLPLWECMTCGLRFGCSKDLEDVTAYRQQLDHIGDAADARAFCEEIVPQALAVDATQIRWKPPWIFFTIAGSEVLMEPCRLERNLSVLRFFEGSASRFEHKMRDAEFEVNVTVCSESEGKDLLLEIVHSTVRDSVLPRRDTYPQCAECEAPLRTRLAQQCFECGFDWH